MSRPKSLPSEVRKINSKTSSRNGNFCQHFPAAKSAGAPLRLESGATSHPSSAHGPWVKPLTWGKWNPNYK